ncbi:MAG: SUMF1/EgtB/PvdO family nonheme iron enzyme [Spirosomataceae bacterium]
MKLLNDNGAWSWVKPAQLADENCHDCPITQVSWEETQAFFQKLNQLSSLSYRLPTEAEWEYAAREEGKKAIILPIQVPIR